MKFLIEWFTISSMIVLFWVTLKVLLEIFGVRLEMFSGYWWVAAVVIGAGSAEIWDRFMVNELAK